MFCLLLSVGQRPSEPNQWATGTAGWGQKGGDGGVDWTQSTPVSSTPSTVPGNILSPLQQCLFRLLF